MHNLFQNFKIRALYKTALSSHVPKHIKELSVSCIIASLALGTRNEYRYIVNIFLIMNIPIEKKREHSRCTRFRQKKIGTSKKL
jgi:hypothetical protein